MDLTTIDPLWWIALGVVVVVLVGLLVWSGQRKARRTKRLKGQFKSEYDRAASADSKKKAEDDLERRLARRGDVDLTDLDESDAESLQHHTDELLRSFVDGPQGAAVGMAQLVGRVAAARGYVANEGGVLDLVSVDHPEQVAAMRRSEADTEKAKGDARTEACRRLFLDARVLAERLLAEGRAGHLRDTAGEASSPESDAQQQAPPPGSPTPAERDRDQQSESSFAPPPPAERDRDTQSESSLSPPAESDHDPQSESSSTPPPPLEADRDGPEGAPPPPEDPVRPDDGDPREPSESSSEPNEPGDRVR